MITTTKRCRRCQKRKNSDREFYKKPDARDGYSNTCKVCTERLRRERKCS